MKKASLNLSVNAIVVFVLAFALLSVGLFFTNLIKDRIASGTLKAVNLNELKNPPTADIPITVPNVVNIKRGKQNSELEIGFYNRGNTVAASATLNISKCINSTKAVMPGNKIPLIASDIIDVDSTTGVGFPVILTERKLEQGTYICTLDVVNSDTGELYESKSFRLVVGS